MIEPVAAFPLEDPLPAAPFPLLTAWLEEARASAAIRNADAMALATIDTDGTPQVRFVLCRGVDVERARFSFYTNYDSDKGRALDAHPRASAAFYWDPLGRQVRLTGQVEKAPPGASDAYFASRPPLSQLAAWASDQSRPIRSREALEAKLEASRQAHGDGGGAAIPRPPHWGGYVLEADTIELWGERPGRLHDRVCWRRTKGSPESRGDDREGGWMVERLQP